MKGAILMKRYSEPVLTTVAIFAAFWAYTIADTLIRELAKDVTFIDLGALFMLGLISGLSLGLIVKLRKGYVAEVK
jgi:hypothetical protein